MKRWQMTLGLAGAAVVAAALAPRLTAIFMAPTPAPPDVAVTKAPVGTQVEAPPPSLEQGRLIVDAGLDRPSILKNTGSERFLTISVRAPIGEGAAVRMPVNLAVVLDASGSMRDRGKLDYAKRAAKQIVNAMGPTDEFSLIAFNDTARVIVPAGPITDIERVYRQIDRISDGGGTALYAGMESGERQVLGSLDPGEVGKLVVLSDGKANVGRETPDALSRFAARAASKGLSVSTLGLGIDFREDVMANLADVGGGHYQFVDDPSELATAFTQELERTGSVVARNTAITVDLPTGVEPIEVIGWQATRTATGWQVYMGDIAEGAERKIVARVRVTGNHTGELEVASVRAEYTDLVDQVQGMSSDVATAEITVDPNRVRANIDAAKAAAANRAWGNRYLEMSTQAYAEGDLDRAKQMLDEGGRVLQQGAASTGDASLEQEAQVLLQQRAIYEGNKPTSREGRRAIKLNKETYRGAYQ